MADPVATVRRESKNYTHQLDVANAALTPVATANGIIGPTKVGETYVTTDGVRRVVTAVTAAGALNALTDLKTVTVT